MNTQPSPWTNASISLSFSRSLTTSVHIAPMSAGSVEQIPFERQILQRIGTVGSAAAIHGMIQKNFELNFFGFYCLSIRVTSDDPTLRQGGLMFTSSRGYTWYHPVLCSTRSFWLLLFELKLSLVSSRRSLKVNFFPSGDATRRKRV